MNKIIESIQSIILENNGFFNIVKSPHIPKKRDCKVLFNGFYLNI